MANTGILTDPQFWSDIGSNSLSAAHGAQRGIMANALGGPVDLINAALGPLGLSSLAPVMGSEWIGQHLQDLGVLPPRQQNLPYRAGEFFGPMLAVKAPDVIGALAEAAPRVAARSEQLLGNVYDNLQPQLIAYHGTPHSFDEFDASKIGTGEGAQAYGHGLYFAENPSVAKNYQLNNGRVYILKDTGGPIDWSNPEHVAAAGLFAANGDRTAAIEGAKAFPTDGVLGSKALALLEGGAKLPNVGTAPPSMYKVDIPDEMVAKMLDWDKPMSQQPENVRTAFNKWVAQFVSTRQIGPNLVDVNIGGGSIGAYSPDKVPEVLQDISRHVPTRGKDFWQMVGGDTYTHVAPEVRSELLNNLGVPGIKYLDQSSRTAGDGTHNFVVFPGGEKQIKILGK